MHPYFVVLFYLIFTVQIVTTENESDPAAGKVGEQNVAKVSLFSPSKLLFDFVDYPGVSNPENRTFRTPPENDTIEVTPAYNFTHDNESFALLNETRSTVAPRSRFKVGKWTVVSCINDKFSWLCKIERHLVIKELGFQETVIFVVAGSKLRIGCSANTQTTIAPTKAETGRRLPNFNVRFLVQCPSPCKTECPELYPYFWLGLGVGILSGMVFVSLLAMVVMMAFSKPAEEGKNKDDEPFEEAKQKNVSSSPPSKSDEEAIKKDELKSPFSKSDEAKNKDELSLSLPKEEEEGKKKDKSNSAEKSQ